MAAPPGECVNKWALIVDVAKCTNCQNCVLATRDEHVGNAHAGYDVPMPSSGTEWITIERRTRGNDSMVDVSYIPRTCNHCDDAPCVRAAGDGAIYKRADGLVIIDPVKSRGRRDLVESCPYGMISWNQEAEVPQKWSFDAHLLDAGWGQPRCAQACPTGAMQSLRLGDNELQKLRARDALEEIRPELQTRSRVLYRNLHRATRCFLGGTVTRGGGLENVPGARVELHVPGAPPASCVSDSFGDFRFDDLEPTGIGWILRASHPAFGVASSHGTLTESQYLGTLELVKL
jgi:Fe-S-cluster-containing dehydrogenase component